MPAPFSGDIGMLTSDNHAHRSQSPWQHGEQPDFPRILGKAVFEDLGQPETKAVQPHNDAEIDGAQQPDFSAGKSIAQGGPVHPFSLFQCLLLLQALHQ
ncbi:MAG: hypothetical protein BWY83_02955 [bacterium ADurb.Bin478]|nr:MAG: hypothetical protein BWY83_02955 [bacterium ADurb.Bin478]